MKRGYLYLQFMLTLALAGGLLLMVTSAFYQLYSRTERLHVSYRMYNDFQSAFQNLQIELKSSPGIIDTVSYPSNSQQLSFWTTEHTPRILSVRNQRLALIGEGTTYLTAKEYPITEYTFSPLARNIYRLSLIVNSQHKAYPLSRSFQFINEK